MKRFRSLDEFFCEDPRRKDTEQVSFGDHWRTGIATYPLYRLRFLQDTGEICAFATPRRPSDTESVLLLGVAKNADHASKLLDGWVRECGKPRSLEWVKQRLTGQTR